jgi:succinate dehydrogenase hydrophobic anchor subunit
LKDTKELLREDLVKAKLYRAVAFIFAICGFAIFMFMMSQLVSDGVYQAFKNPFMIVILVVPFLPSVVLSWLAVRAERKVGELMGSHQKST